MAIDVEAEVDTLMPLFVTPDVDTLLYYMAATVYAAIVNIDILPLRLPLCYGYAEMAIDAATTYSLSPPL